MGWHRCARTRCIALALVAVLASPREAFALDVEVEIRGPESRLDCLDAAALERHLNDRESGLVLRAEIEADSVSTPSEVRAWTVAVRAGAVAAERRLELGAAPCGEVRDAVQVVAALLVRSVAGEVQADERSARALAGEVPAAAAQRSALRDVERARGVQDERPSVRVGARPDLMTAAAASDPPLATGSRSKQAAGIRSPPLPAGLRGPVPPPSVRTQPPAERALPPELEQAPKREPQPPATRAPPLNVEIARHRAEDALPVDSPGELPRLTLGLGAGVRSGVLPDPGAWPYAGLGVHWPSRLSVQLRAGMVLPQQRHGVAEGRLHFTAYSLALAGCAAPLPAVQGLSLCAELQGGVVHASAAGLALGNRTQDEFALRAALRLGFEVGLGSRAGRLGVWADGGRALVRPMFVVRDAGGARVAALVSPTWGGGAGISYAFFL